MRHRARGALLLGFVALAAGAWVWLDRAPREASGPDAARLGRTDPPVPTPILVGRERPQTDADGLLRARIAGRVWNGRTGERATVRAWMREDVPARLEASWWWPILEEGVARSPDLVTASDSEGRFGLEDVPAGSWWLVAESPAGRATARLRVTATGGEVPVDLRLLTGLHAVRGRVRMAEGAAWRGRVFAIPDDGKHPEERSLLGEVVATTGAEGDFELTGVPAGRSLLGLLDSEGRLQVGWAVDVPLQVPIDVTVEEGLSWVAGRVLADADGRPLEGAVVRARSPDEAEPIRVLASVSTDAAGRFRLPFRGHPLFVLVRAPGYAEARFDVEAPLADLEVGLLRAGRIAGRVTRDDGMPSAGARVEATVNSHGGHPDEVPATWTRTAADGSYVIEGAPLGPVFLRGMTEGWVTKELSAVDVPRDGEAARDLVLSPAGRVEGRVLDLEGRPAPGVPIGFRVLRMVRGDPLQHEGDLRSDHAGAFSVDDLVPGERYAFWVVPDPGHRWMHGEIHATAARPARLDLHLERFHPLEVTVLDEDGHAIEGADVSTLWAGTIPRSHSRTAVDGTAALGPVEEGGITVRVRRTGYAPVVVPSGDETRLLVRLARGLPVAGVVVNSQGDPVVDCRLEVLAGEQRYAARSARDGRFRIAAAPVGTWHLTASGHWRWGVDLRQRVAAGDEGLRIVLPGGLAARPKPEAGPPVKGPDGRPVAYARVRWPGAPEEDDGARPPAPIAEAPAVERGTASFPPVVVTVLGPEGDPAEGIDVWTEGAASRRTDAEGRCVLEGLSPEVPVSLVVSPSWHPAGRSVLPTIVAAWRPCDSTVRLERAYVVHGVVEDLAGRPLRARVLTRRSPEEHWSEATRTEDGRFEVQDVPARGIEMKAVVGRRAEGSFGSEGPAGERADVTTPESEPRHVLGTPGGEVVLPVDTGLPLVVRVRSWTPPMHAAQVVLTPEARSADSHDFGDSPSRATIGDDGVARFRYLLPDRSHVLRIVVPEQGRSVELRGVRGSDEELVVDLVEDGASEGR